MDKMCHNYQVGDLNSNVSNAEETENVRSRASPVFKCFNPPKTIKENHLDSSDYDIPSYQVNQSIKSRTSSKNDNEISESVLPFSPIFSPIPITSSAQFQPPSIHSLGTIAKNSNKFCQNRVNYTSNIISVQTIKPCEGFESLGMTDKDISWVSSMATPPPKQVPGSEFNTVEKATFFPEDKFQKIQPRALFSPDSDDDGFGCHPIESTPTHVNDEEYQSNIRLSDVCATLRGLEVRSLDQVLNDSAEKVINEKDELTSPVLETRKIKLGSDKKEKSFLLVSSENKDKYEFSVSENLKSLECENKKCSEINNFIEDDSFQSMSFSVIDELCKTLVSEQSSYSVASKVPDCDETLLKCCMNNSNQTSVLKKFYSSKTAHTVYAVSSMSNLHSYARALEECDKCSFGGNKIDQLIAEKGIVRVDVLSKDYFKIDATKRLHSEINETNDQNLEKKLKKGNAQNSDLESMQHYLSESQLNVSDGEIFRTVENLEKTLASQESKVLQKLSNEKLQDEEAISSQKSDMLKVIVEEPKINKIESKNIPSKAAFDFCPLKDSNQSLSKVPTIADLTIASRLEISVSENTINKTKDVLKVCDQTFTTDGQVLDIANTVDKQFETFTKKSVSASGFENDFMKEYSTSPIKSIKISVEVSKNPKFLMSECKNMKKMPEESAVEKKFEGKVTAWLGNGSGKQSHVSVEVLEKPDILISDFKGHSKEQFDSVTISTEGFSTGSGKKIQVSAAALEKARILMAECDKTEENLLENDNQKDSEILTSTNQTFVSKSNKSLKEKINDSTSSFIGGFSTLSGKQIQVSADSLEKAKFLFADAKEEPFEGSFKGFFTGSGKSILVSKEALEKGKSFIKNCESEFNERSDKFASKGVEDVPNQAVFKDNKTEVPQVCFSSALGNEVKISSRALEKAKEFWSKENLSEMPELKEFPPPELPLMGFVTAAGSEVIISESALIKAKERMNQVNMEDSENCVITNKSPLKKEMKIKAENSRPEQKSVVDELNDESEIIPSWLHVYNTSPSIAFHEIELSPSSSEKAEKPIPDRTYIVKSPVFGLGDRFQKKTRRRKLQFEDDNKNSGKKSSTKRTSTLPLDFSVPFKKIKVVENPVIDVKTERALAREEQEKTIKGKEKVKPVKGSHLNRKSSETQISWKKAVGESLPEVYSDEYLRTFGISDDVLQINIENAAFFRFSGENFFGSSCTTNTTGIQVGDGCLLILDDQNKFGMEELKRAFLASPGVQPNLVPHGWVENHIKWIVWKLAHYEKSFPQYFGGNCLTPNHMLLQLKYRYDREIDRNERSALKKILERDDIPAKRLVLCICGIKKISVGETFGYELQLTDGWYSCPVQTDPAMTRLIEERKLAVGTKLVIQGAILMNCEQGVSPLENNGTAYLKISTNSTRRIRWDTKLGFQKNPENFPVSLASILPQGGPISRIDVIIVRVYPMLYMEKTSDGHHVTRNRRLEEKAEYEYRRIQEQRMETICNEIQSEMRKPLNLDKKSDSLNDVDQVEELCQLMESSSDPSALQELSSDQRKLLRKFQSNQSRELTEKIERELEKEKLNKRNVSEFLRVKIVDFRRPDFNNPALLSAWNPSEDLTGFLSEGKVISLMNVTISNHSRIYKTLQINTTRQTQYRQINRSVKYPSRKLTQIKDVSSKVCPAFEEVDVVGMVALIQDVSYGSRLSQVVYLTDLEMNFVGVVFWGSCKNYGWENVLKIPSIVACSNLQWKKNYTHQDVPSVYVNENSVFTENPKHSYLKEEIERLKQSMPEDKTAFLSKCEEDLTTKLEDSKWRTNISKNSSANDSNVRETLKSRSVNGFDSRPTASSTPIKQISFKINSEEAEPSPIQKKIEKLKSYGEPPSLIPLLIRNNPKRKFKRKS